MRIGGIASGMDTNQMIADLMRAERMPLDKLFQKRQIVDWQRDAYREMNLSLAKFRDSASNMRLQSTFTAYTASSSNLSAVSATAGGSAVPGTYNVEVTDVAKVAKVNSLNKITNLAGSDAQSTDKILNAGETESFSITTKSGTYTINIDDTTTYGSLATTIASETGLRASFDNTTSRFFFSTKEMGGDEEITFGESIFVREKILAETDPANPTQPLSYTGNYGRVVFDNNIVVENLKKNETTINGITLSLLQVGTSTVTIKSDTESALNNIKAFVESYNNLVDEIQGKLSEAKYREYPPLTNEQREAISEKEAERWDERSKSGLLRNDSLLRNVLTDLRRSFSDTVEGVDAGALNHLSQIGITTGDYRSGGKLVIDETKLKTALSEKPDEVMNLFTKSATQDGNKSQMGYGRRVYEEINLSLDQLKNKAGIPGSTIGDNSTLGKNLRRINQEMTRFEDRLVGVEDRYWRQFTAMEKALEKMNQQSAWMAQNMFGGQ
jgi:flagellar hook-associated protein 2